MVCLFIIRHIYYLSFRPSDSEWRNLKKILPPRSHIRLRKAPPLLEEAIVRTKRFLHAFASLT